MIRTILKRVIYGIALCLLLFAVLMLTPRAHGVLWPDKPPIGYHYLWSTYLAVAVGLEKVIDTKPKVPSDIEAFENVTYKKVNGDSLALDIYRPRHSAEAPPLLIFLHGGSWRWGKRADMLPLVIDFARRGYVTATVSYRLDGYPGCVEDVDDAVDWLMEHGDLFGYDTRRVAFVGASAGAHLAMLAAYRGSNPERDSTANDYPIKAIVNLFGPVDLTSDFAKHRSTVQGFLGATYDEAPHLYEEASPLFAAHSQVPPTMTIHSTSDEIVPNVQADKLKDKLEGLNVTYVDYRFPLWPHALILIQRVYDYCIPIMDDFLQEHLADDAIVSES